jgi:hypothetical protein
VQNLLHDPPSLSFGEISGVVSHDSGSRPADRRNTKSAYQGQMCSYSNSAGRGARHQLVGTEEHEL